MTGGSQTPAPSGGAEHPSGDPPAASGSVGVDPGPPAEPVPGANPSGPGDPLQAYLRRMRRQRRWYAAIVTVVVVVVATFVAVLWSRGEAAHAVLHTAAKPPASLPLDTPSQTQQVAWRTTDRLAIGDTPYEGTVITYGKRTVRGRDARTGRQTWSYTRTDRTVCTAAQLGGVTIAIFNLNGNCDQLSAFASDTGKRRWTRTLDIDGQPLNGHPAYQWRDDNLMVTSPNVIYSIDPSSGLNRWTYSRFGCRINAAVLGSAGALVSQTCVRPNCDNLKLCAAGTQLFLRQREAPNGDSSAADRDQFRWNKIGNDDVPVAAGVVVAALDPTTRRLTVFDADKGTATSVSLSPTPASTSIGPPVETDDAQVMWVGGVTYAIEPNGAASLWAVSTSTAPTLGGTETHGLSTASLAAGVTDGFATIDGNTGEIGRRFTGATPGAGGHVTPMGTGFVVSGATGIVVYR